MGSIKEKYNLNKLVKVETSDFRESYIYTYKTERKLLFGLYTRKDGVYDDRFNTYYGKTAPKNHTIKDGIVYEKPGVTLFYQSNIQKTYYFESYEQAINFARNLTDNKRFID